MALVLSSQYGKKYIIMITLKGAIRDFFFFFNNLLTAPWTVSNTYAQVAWAQSCANHVQHIERLSRATCRDTCHVVQRDSSAITFESLNRIYLSFILLAEPLTDEEGEETGVPRENPWWRVSENATYWSPKIQAPSETQTHTIALVAGNES